MIATAHTVGGGLDDILLLRDAVDADVQEAAYHDAEEKYDAVD